MALDTKCLFPIINQMKLILSAHWVVTGGTGDHLAGVYIKNIRTDWMRESSLSLMAIDTACIIAIPFQH